MHIKNLLLALPIAMLPLTITTSCNKQDHDHHHTSMQQRQTMAPAKTDDEWIQRLKTDLSEPYVYNDTLGHLYAELPPQDQWPSITKQLYAYTEDQSAFKKHITGNNSHRSTNQQRIKLRLFASLLQGPSDDQEQLFKELLNHSQISNYHGANTIHYLTAFTKDADEAAAWLKSNHPAVFHKDNSSHSSYSSDKDPWDKPLAEGNIDEGIKLLKSAAHAQSASEQNRLTALNQLLKLAIVLEKTNLAEDTANRLEKIILKKAYANSQSSYHGDTRTLTNYFANTNQWQRIFDLTQALHEAIAKKNSRNKTRNHSTDEDLITADLTATYHIKGIKAFAPKLEAIKNHINDYPQLLDSSCGNQPKIGNLYIDYLITKNDKSSALNILTNLLARNSGTDAYYAKLLEIDPDNAATLIKQLHAFDPYEERPLIWLAEIALKNNEIEKAEKTIQQAIDLDPSDGDHGKNSRMLCYDVLARILQKQGNQEKADFFLQVVQSIRDGEAADDFRYAGLTSEATRRYKAALGKFNDAYCLQSRLALTLAKNGKFDEAIPHFEKAFNLMPVSFGPRESHCFGCEGLFDDIRVQKLALPILQAFAKKNPENPRTPYLLGLVFTEMNKPTEAATAFKKALDLDPNYFNAASRLYQIIGKAPDKASELANLSKTLFKLAPYRSKPEYIPNNHALKNYWETANNFPAPPFKLTPLTPKQEPSQQQYISTNSGYMSSLGYFSNEDAIDGWSKDELCLNNKFLNYLRQLQAKN